MPTVVVLSALALLNQVLTVSKKVVGSHGRSYNGDKQPGLKSERGKARNVLDTNNEKWQK